MPIILALFGSVVILFAIAVLSNLDHLRDKKTKSPVQSRAGQNRP